MRSVSHCTDKILLSIETRAFITEPTTTALTTSAFVTQLSARGGGTDFIATKVMEI
jgi:hypothetical protein